MVSFTPFIEPEILNIMINYCGKLETEFENILACLYKNKVKNLGTSFLYELDLKMLWANSLYLKGQSNESFNIQFFHHLNQPGTLIFSILVRFSAELFEVL